MTQHYSAHPGGQTTVIVQQSQSNALGMAGFVTAIISFLTCGLLAPVALLLSLFGMLFRPRGYALAGVLISGGSLVVLFICWGLFLGAILVGSGAIDQVQEAAARVKIQNEIRDFYTDHSRVPTETEFSDLLSKNNLHGRFEWVNSVGASVTLRTKLSTGIGHEFTFDASKPFLNSTETK